MVGIVGSRLKERSDGINKEEDDEDCIETKVALTSLGSPLLLLITSKGISILYDKIRVNISSTMAMHWHSSEKCPKEIIVLLKFKILLAICIGLSLLGTLILRLRSKSFVMCFLLRIDEGGIGI